MRIERDEPCPVPQDPILADVAAALRDTGDWGWVVDADWRLVYMTDQLRLSFGGMVEMAPAVVEEHLFGPAVVQSSAEFLFGPNRLELWREFLVGIGGFVLADTVGGRDDLRERVDPDLGELVDELTPVHTEAVSFSEGATTLGGTNVVMVKALRIRDSAGKLHGTVILPKPSAGMSILSSMAFVQDLGHFERMHAVSRAGRRPAAILFGDLDGSSALARMLSTGSYFGLLRRIVRATDQCVVDAGGLVGRHAGDGVVAFFPAETFESESAAARACIGAARAIRAAVDEVAGRSELGGEDVVMRFGLHWGSTLYIGNITSSARTEVTALGDEVNEAARIETCATGGRVLASKQLIERLDFADAAALELEAGDVVYTKLADLPTATDKARRDAPAIAVCEL